MDYQKAYYLLFNAMTDAIVELEQVRQQSQNCAKRCGFCKTHSAKQRNGIFRRFDKRPL